MQRLQDQVANRLDKWAHARILWSLFAIVLVISLVDLLYLGPELRRLSARAGHPYGAIDSRFTYTAAEAYGMIETYGPEGRALYLVSESTLDIIYPLAYGLLAALLITYTARKLAPGDRRLRWAALLGPIGALFDLLENLCVIVMLVAHPNKPVGWAQAASVFTPAKWIADALGFGAVLISLLLLDLFRAEPARWYADRHK